MKYHLNSEYAGTRHSMGSSAKISAAACLKAALSYFNSTGFLLINDAGVAKGYSYQEIGRKAEDCLKGFLHSGMRSGDVLIIQTENRVDFLASLWAALMGNMIALPLEAGIGEAKARRLMQRKVMERLAGDSRTFFLSSADSRSISTWSDQVRPTQWVNVNSQSVSESTSLPVISRSNPEDTRLLILTSGTTGKPSLVQLPDRAVVSRWWPNGTEPANNVRYLSWAPLDHAMGLSACSPNADLKVVIHTATFLRDPLIWLDLSSRHRITHTTMTSFGMRLILDAISRNPASRLNAIDLSAMSVVGVGAEPLQSDVFIEFSRVLEDLGVTRDNYVHSYGLTECGPVVSGRVITDTGEAIIGLAADRINLGFNEINTGHCLRISCQEDLSSAQDDAEGEIEVRGPSMANGYFCDKKASRMLFTRDGWLRTGDIGHISNGKLLITGRMKETLIINAVKYPCNVIERLATSIPEVFSAYAVNASGTAPNGKTGGYNLFISPHREDVAAEILAMEVLKRVTRRFGIRPINVVFLDEVRIPRTSLGKVRRGDLATLAAESELKTINWLTIIPSERQLGRGDKNIRKGTALEQKVSQAWKSVLGHTSFGLSESFFSVGGDSLAAAQLTEALGTIQGENINIATVFQHETIASQAEYLIQTHNHQYPGLPPLDERHLGERRIRQRQLEFVARWSGQRCGNDSLIFYAKDASREGDRAAQSCCLFWCFQGNQEFQSMAERLRDDVLLFGLRSGHLIMEDSDENRLSLAAIYARELRRVYPHGDFILGGNCQGARLIRTVAGLLTDQGRSVTLLMLMEEWRLESYAKGKVELIFGAESHFNPFLRQPISEVTSSLIQNYPRGYSVHQIPGSHGRFFNPNHVRGLTSIINRLIECPRCNTDMSQESSRVSGYHNSESGPLMACVVISVGSSPWLTEAVRSLLQQKPQPEVLVVSTGGKSPKGDLEKAGIKVAVQHRRLRRYVGAARNIGIKHTKAPFVAFLADDCIAQEDWVQQRLSQHLSGQAAVASAVVPIDWTNLWSLISHVRLFVRRLPGTPASEIRKYGVSYERTLFQEYGFFKEDIRHGEDTDYHSRFERDIPIYWAPEVATAHRHPDTLRSLIIDQFRRGRRRRALLEETTTHARTRLTSSRDSQKLPNELRRIFRDTQLSLNLARFSFQGNQHLSFKRIRLLTYLASLMYYFGYKFQQRVGGIPNQSRNEKQLGGDPIIHVLLRFRNEARYLESYLEHLQGKVDGIIALDDGSTDGSTSIIENHPLVRRLILRPDHADHVWDEPGDRRLLVNAALEHEADWLLVLDADERLELSFRSRALPILEQAYSAGHWGLGMRVLECWDSSDQVRVDGIWGNKSSPRFFLARHDHEFDNRGLHGAWAPMNSRVNGQFPIVDLIIYHLKMIDSKDREKRQRRYQNLDRNLDFQRSGYDYLTDTSGIRLQPIDSKRQF